MARSFLMYEIDPLDLTDLSFCDEKAIQAVYLWHGRYRITDVKVEHMSDTCQVYMAYDETSPDSPV